MSCPEHRSLPRRRAHGLRRWTRGTLVTGTALAGVLAVALPAFAESIDRDVVLPSGTGERTLILQEDLIVGDRAAGTLQILDGSDVSNHAGIIGRAPAAKGAVRVNGAGSTWTNSGSLTIGDGGAGTLDIVAGAAVTSASGTIGNAAGSTGTVTVDRESTWTGLSNLAVGAAGTGALNITAGGRVSSTAAQIGTGGGSGAVSVIGDQSDLTIVNALDLGNAI